MKPVAMVLEAGGGVGLESSLELAQSGFRVFASVPTINSSSTLSRRARERGVDVSLVTMNVTSPASVSMAVAEVLSYTGRLDVLVDTGSLALTAATEAVLPTMRAAGHGRIVSTTCSVATRELRQRVSSQGLEMVLVDANEAGSVAKAIANASARHRSGFLRFAGWLGLL